MYSHYLKVLSILFYVRIIFCMWNDIYICGNEIKEEKRNIIIDYWLEDFVNNDIVKCSSRDIEFISDRAFQHRKQNETKTSKQKTRLSNEFTIRKLHLNTNLIKLLPSRVFAELLTLEVLGLDGNQLTTLSADMFPNNDSQLRTLSLRYNRISLLSPGFADNLLLLEYLDLAKNKLLQLEHAVFAVLFNMSSLKIDVSENPFTCMCDHLSWFVDAANSQGNIENNTNDISTEKAKNYTSIMAHVSIPDHDYCKNQELSEQLKCVFDDCLFIKDYILDNCHSSMDLYKFFLQTLHISIPVVVMLLLLCLGCICCGCCGNYGPKQKMVSKKERKILKELHRKTSYAQSSGEDDTQLYNSSKTPKELSCNSESLDCIDIIEPLLDVQEIKDIISR